MYIRVVSTVVEGEGNCVVGVGPIVVIALGVYFSFEHTAVVFGLDSKSEGALLALPYVFLGGGITLSFPPIAHVSHEHLVK